MGIVIVTAIKHFLGIIASAFKIGYNAVLIFTNKVNDAVVGFVTGIIKKVKSFFKG